MLSPPGPECRPQLLAEVGTWDQGEAVAGREGNRSRGSMGVRDSFRAGRPFRIIWSRVLILRMGHKNSLSLERSSDLSQVTKPRRQTQKQVWEAGSSASPPGHFRRCDFLPRPRCCRLSSPAPSRASTTRTTTAAIHDRNRVTESKHFGRQRTLEAHAVLLKSHRPHVLVDGSGQGTGPLLVSSFPDLYRGFSGSEITGHHSALNVQR